MPPSVRYYNQTAPFWDFIADLEGQGSNHPAFGGNRDANHNDNNDEQTANPWAGGFGGWPFGGMPHRGRRHGPPHHEGSPPHEHGHNRGPPPPPGSPPPPENPEAGPSEPHGPPPPFSEEPHHGPHHGPGPHRHGRCGGRGGWGGRGRGGPRGFPMGGAPPFLNNLAEMFQSQLFGDEDNNTPTNTTNKDKNDDFKPEADVFDTENSFIIHVSLPGAKKEDVGVNWDADKSELSIAGVIYRPGDEELLKTLALNERKVGAFERKVRLGSRANPAQVDVDGISARMEDGVLRIEVPKLDSGYVEIKKVDIE